MFSFYDKSALAPKCARLASWLARFWHIEYFSVKLVWWSSNNWKNALIEKKYKQPNLPVGHSADVKNDQDFQNHLLSKYFLYFSVGKC